MQKFEMVVKYCGMTIKLMEDQGTLTEILYVRFFMEIFERGRSVQSLFHTVLQVNERSTAATCEVFICA